MNCTPLAATGADANLGLVLIVAALCVLAGLVVLLFRKGARRRRLAAATTFLIAVVAGTFITIVSPVSALAATTDCVSAGDSLTITQTSTMRDLAPGIAPQAITGLVLNNSAESTLVTTVQVTIVAVTNRDTSDMTCDATDFALVDPVMSVGRALGPGESLSFAGASIGFASKATNQDACKNAIVQLLYVANPP